VADIYRELGATDAGVALNSRKIELAKKTYGELSCAGSTMPSSRHRMRSDNRPLRKPGCATRHAPQSRWPQ
jgi:hypothetical protein